MVAGGDVVRLVPDAHGVRVRLRPAVGLEPRRPVRHVRVAGEATVLYEPILLALRRLAHADISVKRLT